MFYFRSSSFMLLIVLFSFGFSNSTKSQAYFNPNINDALRLSLKDHIYDARLLGMGNAATVINDTYSATLFNPASLGLIRKLIVNTSLVTNIYKNDAAFLSDSFVENKTETVLNQAGIIIPLANDTSSNNIVISIGYNRSKEFNRILKFNGFNSSNNSLIQDLTSINNYIPRELQLSYQEFDPDSNVYLGDRTIFNGNLLQDGYVLEAGGLNHWSFGIAYQLDYKIFFGASFNYNVGNYMKNGEFTESDSQNLYPDTIRTITSNPLTAGFQSFYLSDIRDWVFNGFDLRIGALYKFSDNISIGGSVKSPSIISITDDHYFYGKSEFSTSSFAELDTVVQNQFTIHTPFEFSAAADVNLCFFTGAVEITYIDYTQMKFSDGLDIQDRSALNKQISETYTHTLNLKFGAEFRLPSTGLSARAGAMYIPYPVADTPQEFDRKYFTSGLGIRSEDGATEFKVAYIYGFWDQISEDYGNSVLQIYQEIVSQNIVASLTLRF